MRCVVWFLAVMLPAMAAQWTRFRGPNGTGVADASSIPAELRPDKNVAWKIALPRFFISRLDGKEPSF
jgi:outer membrane protein assembly factor BamB